MPKTKRKSAEKKSRPAAPINSRVWRRPQWTGSISFGLVNIPIRLYPATRNKDVRFHLLHDKDNARLQEKMVCAVDREEVPRQDMVKGCDIGKDQHVVVTPEEIAALAPKATRAIELMNVVDIRQIDPMYFDRPLYVIPEERGGQSLLSAAFA